MKSLYFRSSLLLSLFFLMVFTGTAFGQSTANYTFSTVTNGSLESMSSGTTDIFATGTFRDDDASSVIDIGFTFFFMGQPYTQFSINSNGLMRLGSTAIDGGQWVHTAGAAILGPISQDNSLQSTGKAHYKVTGSAPSRVLVVEWDKLRIPYSDLTSETYCTFQVHLSEETGTIEYKYGTMHVSGASASRGIFISSGNTSGQVGSIKNITTVPVYDASDPGVWLSSFAYGAMTNLNSASDGNRRVFTFTPPAAPAPPTGLNFTSIGVAGMTLNWTDNASTEAFYRIDRSTDGITFTTIASIAANLTSYAATGLTPSTTYYWRVIAGTEGALSSALEGSQATGDPAQITSIATGNWSSTTTWSTGAVPTQFDNVVIAGTHTVTINAASTCYDLTVNNGATLVYEITTARTLTVNRHISVASGGVFTTGASGTVITHSLQVHGNLTNNGTLDFSTNSNTAGATITFTGTTLPTVELTLGSSSVTDFRNSSGVTLNKGANRNQTLTFSPGGTLTVQGANTTGFLTISNGYFILGGTGTFSNPLFNSVGYSISSTSGFWLNNSNATVVGLDGSPTLAGLLRVSAGTLNVGISNTSMDISTGAIVTIEGGALNTASRFAVAHPVNPITYSQSGGTVTVNMGTIGNTSGSTYASFDMGISSFTSFTMSGGTVIVQRGSADTELRGAATTATVNITGGTFQLGNASTAASTTFRILGVTPNLVVNATNNPGVLLTGNVRIHGDLTINGTGTFSLNTNNNLEIRGLSASNPGNITNNGTMTLNAGSTQTMTFSGSFGNQTFTNNGTITASILPSLTTNNTFSGGTVTLPASLVLTNGTSTGASLTLTAGTLSATGLTFGSGGTAGFSLTRTNGSLLNAPTFNFGSGAVNYTYNGTSQQTTGNELPSTISGTFTLNNSAGVVLNSPLSVGSLTLTTGILTTTDVNLLTVTGTTTGSAPDGAATAYVNGPLVRRLPASLVSGSTYVFPVGKGGSFNPIALVDALTTAGGTVAIRAEVFAANSGGTAGTGLSAINTDRYWQASITSGGGNFTSSKIRLTDATVQNGRRVGQAATVAGSYSAIGGSFSGTNITSDAITTMGYFLVGTTNLTFSGSVNVGTGQTYTTLTGTGGLFSAINIGVVTGNVTVSITSDLTEVGAIALEQWLDQGGPWNLTIQPADATLKTISGSFAGGLIRLDGADRVTIDGRSGGSGKYLRFRNTNTANPTFTLINDASNNTIRDCHIEGATTSVTNGVVFFSTGITTGNDNNTLINCVIRDRSDAAGVPYFLMYSAGSSASVTNTGNTISGNELFNFSSTGIRITSTGNENWTITGNEIYQASARTTALAGIEFSSLGTNTISQNTIRSLNTNIGIYGIWLGDARNTTVSRNRIKIVDVSGSTSTWIGIQFAGESGTAVNVTLVNNQITLIPLTATSMSIRGIHDNAYLGNTLNVYYNSVYIGGTATGTSTWAYQRRMGRSTIGTLKNNIFFNNRTGGSVDHFALGDQSNGGTFTVSNNLYAGTGIISANFMERGTSGIAESFSAWKTAKSDLASYASIASSLSAVNLFSAAATGDLNITPGNTECWAVNGKGIALTGNADDYSATGVRSATAGTSSDIGSDEFIPTGAAVNAPAATASGLPAASTTTTYTVTANQVGSIIWGAGGIVPTSLTFRYYSGSQAPSAAPGDRAYQYYDISQAGGSGFTFDITLWYDEGQLNGIAEADLRPARSTDGGNTWTPYLTTGTGPGQYQINTTANTVTLYGLTDFFLFTLTSQSSPLPVQLSSFTSALEGRDVLLNWETQTEENANKFVVERKSETASSWITIGEIRANGNSNSPKKYNYTDMKLNSGKYSYRLKMIDNDGTFEYSDIIETDISVPKEYAISQNYPNPFNPTTKIDFQLPFDSQVHIELYNITGERVATLMNMDQKAGYYTFDFTNTSHLSSGVYIYRIIATGAAQDKPFTAVKKMVMMK